MDTVMQLLARVRSFLPRLRERFLPRGMARVTRALTAFEKLIAELERAIREMDDELIDNAMEVNEARKAYYDLAARKMARNRAVEADLLRTQNVRRKVATLVEGTES